MRVHSGVFSLLVLTGCVDANDPDAGPKEDLQLQTTGTPTVGASTTELTIPSGVVTKISLAGESWDVGGMHSTTSNPSRLIAPVDGIYQVSATISWRASSAGTQRYVTFRKPGGSDLALSQVAPVKSPSYFTTQVVSAHVKLAAGEYIEPYVFQDTGASLNVVVGSHVEMAWIAAGI